MDDKEAELSDPKKAKQNLSFFNPSCLDKSKQKIKNIKYHITHCCRTNIKDGTEYGAWCVLIKKTTNNPFSLTEKTYNSYMLSSYMEKENHIIIRLNGICEILDWIHVQCSDIKSTVIDVELFSTDVYIVNLLREWIPKWASDNFSRRPNEEIIKSMHKIISTINLTVSWQSDKSLEMDILSKKVDELMII